MSGTADVTSTSSSVALSLRGTAEDANCDCIKEVDVHVVFDGTNDRFTEIVRDAKNGTTVS